MVVHFAAAAHEETLGDVLAAVTTAAGKLQLFQQMDALALHLSVTDEVEGGGQTGQTGADDICGFLIDILRLFGMCKRFISSCGIIHDETLLYFGSSHDFGASVAFWLYYTPRSVCYNGQKKRRDENFVTARENV